MSHWLVLAILALLAQLVLFGQISFDVSSAVKLEGLFELQSGLRKLLTLPQLLNTSSMWSERKRRASNETYQHLLQLLEGCGDLCDLADRLHQDVDKVALNCTMLYTKSIDPPKLSNSNSVHQLVWRYFSHFGKITIDPRLIISPYIGGLRQVHGVELGRRTRRWSSDKVQRLMGQCDNENAASSSMVL